MKIKRKIPSYVRKIIIEKKRLSQKKLYTENWDSIRRKVYQRDGYRCVLCFRKGKVHAHHIIPVAVSHDNSLSNLITVCAKCHRKLEAIGYKILEAGGHRSDVRRVEFKMILEAQIKRKEKLDNDRKRLVEINSETRCENIQETNQP